MVQGTASHVGKSLLVAGLARALRRRGLTVAPFKSQNMSLNSGVTPAGDEIGRAQVLQCAAAGATPRWQHNPVLLKPTADTASQVVVAGRPLAELEARDYFAARGLLRPLIWRAYADLAADADVVLLEGAGSPAEINLPGGPDQDWVNMGLARLVDAPVLLVGDIDRGGVFAAFVGTLVLLDPEDRARVHGLIVNKLRGDPTLLGDADAILRERAGAPLLGALPWLPDLGLDEEDGVAYEGEQRWGAGPLRVAAVRLDRPSNLTDLDALRAEPDVELCWTRDPALIAGADLVLLPGSKTTRGDLALLRRRGLDQAITAAHRAGATIVGLCGGYQMLGRRLDDPDGIEGPAGASDGLGLLAVDTVFTPRKTLRRVAGRAAPASWGRDDPVTGYEIHMGRTSPTPGSEARPWLDARGRHDGAPADAGACSDDGRVLGAYLHGLFDAPAWRRALLDRLRARRGLAPLGDTGPARADAREAALERLADAVEAHIDVARLAAQLAAQGPTAPPTDLERLPAARRALADPSLPVDALHDRLRQLIGR